MDFINTMYIFYENRDYLIRNDKICRKIKELFKEIFDQLKKLYFKNKLLPVELLFRFISFEHKENVLSNYKGVRQELKEEKINIEIDQAK